MKRKEKVHFKKLLKTLNIYSGRHERFIESDGRNWRALAAGGFLFFFSLFLFLWFFLVCLARGGNFFFLFF